MDVSRRSKGINLVVDENISREIMDRLYADGHILYNIRDHHPGVVDSVVLAIASRRREVLITKDTDFGKLIFVDNLPTAGVLLVRLSNTMTHLEQAERVSHWLI